MRILMIALAFVAGANVVAMADDAAPKQKKIRFGIQTAQQDVNFEQLLMAWQNADALGFDSAYVFDHFMPILGSDTDGPCLEGWTLLTALALRTHVLQVGTLVTGNTYRNPALLAKMATTVDILTGGRVVLGIGAAWFEREHEAYGFPFYTAKERAERLDEALQVITKLWTEDHPSFAGKYYTLDKAPFAPKPLQKPHPPIMIGGKGKKWIMPLVSRYAQQWNAPLGLTPDEIRERIAIINAECKRIGRDPCDVEVSAFLVLYAISDVPLAGPIMGLAARWMTNENVARGLLAGSPKQITEKIQTYVDAGVTNIIMNIQPPYDVVMMQRFAKEVMPNFQ
jgi:F420-dependent oxidoreductase-like protein